MWQLGCPRLVSAVGLLLLTSALVVVSFLLLEPLLSLMAEQLPAIKREVQIWLASLSDFIRGIETISREIKETVGGENEAAAGASLPSMMDALWLAPNFGSQILIFLGTLFFFVLTRDSLYQAAGLYTDRLYKADRAVSRYFAAVTLVNVGLGVATAVVLGLIGISDPLLWGLAAGLLNFILYLGPPADHCRLADRGSDAVRRRRGSDPASCVPDGQYYRSAVHHPRLCRPAAADEPARHLQRHHLWSLALGSCRHHRRAARALVVRRIAGCQGRGPHAAAPAVPKPAPRLSAAAALHRT